MALCERERYADAADCLCRVSPEPTGMPWARSSPALNGLGGLDLTSPRTRRPRWRRSSLLHNPILIAWERLLYRFRDPRSIGYFTTGLVLLALVAYSWRLWNVTQSRQQTMWVDFSGNGEAISALQDDDPVVISGVLVGRVHHIEPTEGGARVLVEFFTWQKIRKDATAVNFPQGLMGQRIVLVDRGSVDAELLPDAGRIPGRFQPGIAETMSQIEVLVAQVGVIQAQAEGWIDGDSLHAPAYRRIQGTFQQLQSLVGMMEDVTQYAHGAAATLAQVDGKLRTVHAGVGSIGGDALVLLDQVDPLLEAGKATLKEARPLVEEAKEINAALGDSTSFLVRQLTNDSLYQQLLSANRGAAKVTQFLEGEVSMDFNFNVWRTMRFVRPERR